MLSACKSREETLLEAELLRLRTERDRRAHIAENWDTYRQKVDATVNEYDQLVVIGAYLSPAERLERARKTDGIEVTRREIGWEFTGSRDRLHEFAIDNGALIASSLEVTPAKWTLLVPAFDPADTLGALPTSTPLVNLRAIPPRASTSSARANVLREEILYTYDEIAELNRLIGDHGRYEQVRDDIVLRKRDLASAKRVKSIAAVARGVFRAESPDCSRGRLEVRGDDVLARSVRRSRHRRMGRAS